MTPAQKRALFPLFPLCAPRWQTQAFAPIHALAAAVDAYHTAFFAVLTPPGRGR